MKSIFDLTRMSRALWPGDTYMQQAWLRAVALARKSPGGWLMDKPVERRAA